MCRAHVYSASCHPKHSCRPLPRLQNRRDKEMKQLLKHKQHKQHTNQPNLCNTWKLICPPPSAQVAVSPGPTFRLIASLNASTQGADVNPLGYLLSTLAANVSAELTSSQHLTSSGLLLLELASEAALQQSLEAFKTLPGESALCLLQSRESRGQAQNRSRRESQWGVGAVRFCYEPCCYPGQRCDMIF